MKFWTHILFSIFISLLFLKFFSTYININSNSYLHLIIFIFISSLAAALPDIDESKSKAGKTIWPISLLIKFTLGHRGFFHSLTLIIITIPIAYFLLSTKLFNFLFYPLLLGYLSHIILDSLTPKGTYIFWPLKYKLSGPIHTSSIAEVFIKLILFATNILLIIDFI